jgi:hypothetical protein
LIRSDYYTLSEQVAGFIADYISRREPRQVDADVGKTLIEHGVARFGRNESALVDEPLPLIVALRWLSERARKGYRMQLLLVKAFSSQTDNVASKGANSPLDTTVILKDLEDEEDLGVLVELMRGKIVLAAQDQVCGPSGKANTQKEKEKPEAKPSMITA